MRTAALLAVAAVAASAGCGGTRACKSNTVYLSFKMDGVAAADQIRLDLLVEGGADKTMVLARSHDGASSSIEIDFAGGYQAGKRLSVLAVALTKGAPVGTGSASVVLAGGCTALPVAIVRDTPATKQRGESCLAVDSCAAGVCADGYCCDTLCDDGCHACNLPGHEGSCTQTHACNPVPSGGVCSVDLDCVSGHCVGALCCDQAGSCTPADNGCHAGIFNSCGSHAPTCLDLGTYVADGTSCGTDLVCNDGACGSCMAGRACIPDPTACRTGLTSCANGSQTCVDHGAGCAASCAAIRAMYGVNADGPYIIDPDGPSGGLAPFQVWCAGMNDASKPQREYLTLAHSKATGEPGSNFSRDAGGGPCPCNDETTFFSRVLVVFENGAESIDPTDATFGGDTQIVASPAGCTYNASLGFCQFHALQYAAAASTIKEYDQSGTGNIDLRDTPFAVAPNAACWGFINAQYKGAGSATVSADGKTVKLTGGGFWGAYGANMRIPLVQK